MVPQFIVIEAKDARMDVNTFTAETLLEADNFASHRGLDRDTVTGYAVVKRRGKNWREAYVISTLAEVLKLNTP